MGLQRNKLIKLVLLMNFLAILNNVFVKANINSTDFKEINSIIDKIGNDTGVSLPPELKDFNFGEGVNIFKEKCIKNSGSDAGFEEASQATTTLMECIQNIIDFNTLQNEIEESKPNGNLDTVFNKYCDKRSEGVACVDKFTVSIDPCLTQEEKDQKKVFINITKSLLEFVCHENGNQIALFIAEEGPECFEAKHDSLVTCFNKTMGKYVNNELPTLENLPTLVIKEENCLDMDKLEECVVKELETCKESTPANLVEALFRFVRKETPCGKKKVKTNVNAGENKKLSIVLVGTWTMMFLAKFI